MATCVRDLNGCMYYKPTDNLTQDCKSNNQATQRSEEHLQSYGFNRRCFVGAVNSTTTQSYCYLPRCTGAKGSYTLQIQVGSTWHTCDNTGKIVVNSKVGDVNNTGHVSCPANVEAFCNRESTSCVNDCSGRGRCQKNGQCLCYAGFEGLDCGSMIATKTEWNRFGGIRTITKVKGCPQDEGDDHNSTCNNGTCLVNVGMCQCEVGWKGARCDQEDNLWTTNDTE